MAEAAKNPEIWKAACMLDHFDKIQKLKVCKDETTNTQHFICDTNPIYHQTPCSFQDKIDGVPNFRRVPGYKVYCCGQPTIDGFTAALEKVSP